MDQEMLRDHPILYEFFRHEPNVLLELRCDASLFLDLTHRRL